MAFTISLTISAVVAIIFGILILVWPKLLSTLVGLWLVIHGILQLAYQY